MVQWKLVHGICVVEVCIFLVLCLPLPATWRHSIMRTVANQPSHSPVMRILQFMFVFLLFMLGDAAWGWVRILQEKEGRTSHANLEHDHYFNMRLFRAQRNSYLAFFALFLLFVLWRYYMMIKELVNAETMKKQAENASKSIGTIMDQAREGEKAVKAMKEMKEENDKLKRNLETLKKQSAANNAEYDRLAEEAAKLQSQSSKSAGKKDD